MKKQILFVCLTIGMSSTKILNAQVSIANNTAGGGSYVGWANTVGVPLQIRHNAINQQIQFFTANVQRMSINPDGTTANGTNTSGFIGIGTSNPFSPLHIVGSQNANSQNWRRGLTLSNDAVIQWDGGTQNGLFMGHPSTDPPGNWYAGINSNQTSTSPVDYSFSIFVNSVMSPINPIGTARFFKNLLVSETANVERRFGVNTISPFRVAEIRSNVTTDPQLRLATNNGSWTDFQVLTTGNLGILPQSGRVGINLSSNPSSTLDINGNLRIRNVATGAANSILIGTNANGSTDINVRRLDFTGSPSQVLLGNGTWGTFSSTGLGNLCSVTSNPIAGNYRIPLNNYHFYFTDRGNLNTNYVGIGYTCNDVLPGKLSVFQKHIDTVNTSTTAGYFENSDLLFKINQAYMFGIKSYSNAYNSGLNLDFSANIGGYFNASNARNNIAVVGEVITPTSSNCRIGIAGVFKSHLGTIQSMGVYGFAKGSDLNNYGGNFVAESQTGTTAYGVYSTATGTGLNYAGWFNGNIFMNGNIVLTSDQNLKEDVDNIDSASYILNQLNPVSFKYKQDGIYDRMNLSSVPQYGLIAQEVAPILPTLVSDAQFPASYDSLGNETAAAINFKTLNYEALIPILVKGHQEQSAEIEAKDSIINELENTVSNLNDRLTQLENCLSGILPFLCQLSQQSIQENTPASQEQIRSQLAVSLNNKEAIVLDQNVPNPFAEQTVINFSIPATVAKAQIHFYTAEGKLMQSVDVKDRGLGSITVFGSDLSSGTYTYSLVADGIVVATKRMVKE